MAEILTDGPETHYIARGRGQSIGDPAINGNQGVLSLLRLNRMIAFDPDAGILTCEGGVTLEEILDCFLPRGYFLSVTPGTKYVTVGGAIASDVHGKNHHTDGTFSNFVLDLDLLTPDGEVVVCSPTKQSDLFWATVGGMGLTGMILSARIRLRPVETAFVQVDYEPTANLEETLTAFETEDKNYRYSVAWIDVLKQGEALGRSVIMRGNHAVRDDLPASNSRPLAPPRRFRLNVPCNFPRFTLNKYTVRAFNSVFYRRHRKERRLEDVNTFFYPLDAIGNWSRMYGRRGVMQYQVQFPPASSREGIRVLIDRIRGSSRVSSLAVLKASGPAGKGLLSFPGPGFNIGLDLKVDRQLIPFLHELDRMVLDYGGRLYLAKDQAMTAETFRIMYPRTDEFLAVKTRVDPNHRLSSTQSKRLGLTPAAEQK